MPGTGWCPGRRCRSNGRSDDREGQVTEEVRGTPEVRENACWFPGQAAVHHPERPLDGNARDAAKKLMVKNEEVYVTGPWGVNIS